jgi:hypothetical protein
MDGRSTRSHDSGKSRTKSMEKQRGMAFGFRKAATAVIEPDRWIDFERSKHSVMITFQDNNTESGNPSQFQKKKHNIYRLYLTLQFKTQPLLTQWPFASGLNM